MKVTDLVESQQVLRSTIETILQDIATQLSSQTEQRPDQHGRGPGINRIRSGAIAYQRDWVKQFGFGPVRYDGVLKIGNAVVGPKSALDMTIDAFKQFTDTCAAKGIEVVAKQSDVVELTLGNERANVSYDYGSSFCTITFKVK